MMPGRALGRLPGRLASAKVLGPRSNRGRDGANFSFDPGIVVEVPSALDSDKQNLKSG